eukprot:jgi/Astpho2/5847/Aster-02357
MATAVLTFVIVGHDDHPIFEADLSRAEGREGDRAQYLHQFVLHAALDAVDEQVWITSSMHLGVVDKFNNLQVSAFCTAAHIKFLLLHDGKSDDVIKLFFRDVYEVYLKASSPIGVSWWAVRKGLQPSVRCSGTIEAVPALQVMMNPFFTPTSRITCSSFNQKVRQLARSAQHESQSEWFQAHLKSDADGPSWHTLQTCNCSAEPTSGFDLSLTEGLS